MSIFCPIKYEKPHSKFGYFRKFLLKTHLAFSINPILGTNLYLDHRGVSSHIKVESFGKVDANDRS